MNLKVMRIAVAVVMAMTLAGMSGCGGKAGDTADTATPASSPNAATSADPAGAAANGAESATVRFVDVETGCWALDTAEGRVQPIDLPEAFRKDGLDVSVVLRNAPDMMSACQIGPMKHVEHIEEQR